MEAKVNQEVSPKFGHVDDTNYINITQEIPLDAQIFRNIPENRNEDVSQSICINECHKQYYLNQAAVYFMNTGDSGNTNVTPDSDLDAEQLLTKESSFVSTQIRHRFVIKVFAILSAQLVLTLISAIAFTYSQSLKQFATKYSWIILIAWLAMFILLMVISIAEQLRKWYPYNIIVLCALTACQMVIVGFISVRYPGYNIMLALAIMSGITGGLMFFAIQTKWDITGYAVYLWILLLLFITAIIVALLTSLKVLGAIYMTLGLLVFSLLVVLDTQLVLGGRRMQLSPEEYVLGAICLYVDMFQMFYIILQIIGFE